TGSHSEYHTQHDTHEKINYGGLARVAGKVAALATQIAGPGDARLTYEKVSGPRPMPEQSPGGARDFRLYLGTIPDYTYEGDPGVKVSGTSKDSPAERAGILAGDRIVELGGTKIRNIHDYVYCLQALKAGEKIRMRVVRDGGEKSLEITPMLKAQR
ncbi:MAG TPA: PDZ domain-containing protein, partial [Bdellovibrionales bacterium]|nr:PDZ domain-containing protein [Bdellovibrionales bacterium]